MLGFAWRCWISSSFLSLQVWWDPLHLISPKTLLRSVRLLWIVVWVGNLLQILEVVVLIEAIFFVNLRTMMNHCFSYCGAHLQITVDWSSVDFVKDNILGFLWFFWSFSAFQGRPYLNSLYRQFLGLNFITTIGISGYMVFPWELCF